MLIISLIIIILPVFAQQEHEKIVEEVSVSWWQVPVFAVDKSGNPVTDLEPKDIQVRLNGQQVPSFTLYKRSFAVTEPGKDMKSAQQFPIKKNKVLFLLFDQALSSGTFTSLAKIIAKKIIKDAETDTRFVVMAIDSFSGLVYIGEGGGDNKDQLIEMIEKNVTRKRNLRHIPILDFFAGLQHDSGKHAKYEGKDAFLYLFESASKWNKRKSMGFFFAFETLSLFLNSIEDNKFIYLFSGGLSNLIMERSSRNLGGERGKYFNHFKNAANSLSRSGAVIFIINPIGVFTNNTIVSGKDSLIVLARESGGTYLEGTNEKILEQLENMHRAYYEISFPDLPQLKGPTRKISIKSKRKGIKIHSLRTLEKRKQYDQMNSVEKEMLVLNLITQPQNTLINRKIHAYNARIDKTKKTKKNMIYTVTLPPGYLQHHIDLYKVWLAVNDQGMARLEKMEKESLYPSKNRVKIQFQFPGSQKQKEKDKEIPGETRAYFVLVKGGTDPARASVHGIEPYREDPQLLELEKKRTAAKAKKSRQAISAEEMNHILQGAADYCRRLKQSVFHFYCREKIVETRMPLSRIDKTKFQIKNYLFGYRLIKQGDQIIEERDWISSWDKKKVNRDQVVNTNSFFSVKAVFAPIAILDRTRQDKYNFQFIRFDERKGRRVAVIEALPKKPLETGTLYGTLWIDMEDFSLLKIEAGPKSIIGYWQLQKLADKLITKLHLTLEIDFGYHRQGICFLTKVSFLERYKGGRYVYWHRGQEGWIRTRTRFTYSDYRFFDVQSEVTVQKTGNSVGQ